MTTLQPVEDGQLATDDLPASDFIRAVLSGFFLKQRSFLERYNEDAGAAASERTC